MRVAVIGTGYVGLVTGTCLADSGNDVICVDIDPHKVERLRRGEIPIYEPGLAEMVIDNAAEGRLRFTTDLGEALDNAEVAFIAVGTPQRDDGSANLDALWSVVASIRDRAKEPKIVVVKSTVPVGTNARVQAILDEGTLKHRAASNPEFLKEGYAIEDFIKPDRVVVGVREPETAEVLQELHAPFLRTNHPFLVMSPESAEMTKYVANCMLATKISFINEMANLCERLAADINDVRQGIGHDRRIGFQFLFPGVGYGGSCFPKDVRAMIALADMVGIAPRMLLAVDDVNEQQKTVLYAKVQQLLGELAGKTVAVWGLSFKPRTDDIREAPALVFLRQLLGAGGRARVFDPKAMDNVRAEFGDSITFCDNAYAALDGADALAIATEWKEFATPDFHRMRRLLRQPIIIDGRNLYDPEKMQAMGFVYASIGRRTVGPAQ